MAETTRTAVVVHDFVGWRSPIEGTVPVQYRYGSGVRGATVQLPASEFDRLLALGGIAAPDDAAEAQADRDAAEEPYPAGDEGDAALSALDRADLIAYVGQFPGEQERVVRLERARDGGARATVLRAAGVADA